MRVVAAAITGGPGWRAPDRAGPRGGGRTPFFRPAGPRGAPRAEGGARAVRVERDGAVSTVILDRPHVRNAVDGPTAAALAGAFRDFDADASAHVAVLWGAGGTFCAGAD